MVHGSMSDEYECVARRGMNVLGPVGSDHIDDDGPANRTASLTLPLLQGAVVAHADVTAHVQDAVDGGLVADRALGAHGRIVRACRDGCVIAVQLGPLGL